jgi:hypothetical protein
MKNENNGCNIGKNFNMIKNYDEQLYDIHLSYNHDN